MCFPLFAVARCMAPQVSGKYYSASDLGLFSAISKKVSARDKVTLCAVLLPLPYLLSPSLCCIVL